MEGEDRLGRSLSGEDLGAVNAQINLVEEDFERTCKIWRGSISQELIWKDRIKLERIILEGVVLERTWEL